MKGLPLRSAMIGVMLALVFGAPAKAAFAQSPGTVSITATSVAPATVTLPKRHWLGFYVPEASGTVTPLAALCAVETKVGVKADVINYYQCPDQGFISNEASSAIAHGSIPMVTLELWDPNPSKSPTDQPTWSLKSITSGAHDEYLTLYAQQAKAFGSPVWLRPLHEMNGTWYPWGGTVNKNEPKDFVPAWDHIHKIFTDAGATNVKFVWCPNGSSVPGTTTISQYWPGDAYVDYIALDGFCRTSANYASFWSYFHKGYDAVMALKSSRPLFVAETGCSSAVKAKATWITGMFTDISSKLPKIMGICWLQGVTQYDWRIDSCAASLAAFKAGIRNSTWSDRAATSVSIKSSKSKVRHRKAVTLSGSVKRGPSRAAVTFYVLRPGAKAWNKITVKANSLAAWHHRYVTKHRGTYRFKVSFATDSARWGSTSRTVKVKAS